MRLLSLCFSLCLLHLPAQAGDRNCKNPITQTDINICFHEDFKEVDANLNSIYDAIMKKLQDYDENNGASHSETMQLSQEAWETYRHSACLAKTYKSDGGTIRGMEMSSCKIDLTLRRSEDLETMYNDM